MMQPVVSEEPADTVETKPPVMIGDMKKPEKTPETEPEKKPAEPEEPEPIEPEVPMVPTEEITVEVDYYYDEALTDNMRAALSADIWDPRFNYFSPGETFYTTATFSHQLSVVEQVHPVLSMTLNSEEVTRFTPASGAFASGTYKREEGENRYICKYTVPEGAFGILRFVVELGETTTTNSRYSLQAVPSFVCTVDATATEPAATNRGATAFIGRVLTPRYNTPVIPLEGVRVTVVAGPHTGKSAITDQNGEFVFPGVAEDELRIHLEKECYEEKEMLVSRSRPTALPDGTVLRYPWNDRHRNTPGVVLMGHAWPEPVRPLLEQMTLPHDLLYFHESYDSPYSYYSSADGVVIIHSRVIASASMDDLLLLFAHELFHAHQHATVAVDGSGSISDWENTPDGRAFAEAQRKDHEIFGTSGVDVHPIDPTLSETSANTVERFLWTVIASDADRERREERLRYRDMEDNAPNRLKWVQEWYEKEKMKRN